MPIKQEMFTKGWVNENEISLQPENTVRDMLNMRIISDSQNTYSCEIVKGNTIMFSLNPNYRPIGWTVQGNIICIFSTNDKTAKGGNGEIGVVYMDVNTLNTLPNALTYFPLYNHQGLHFSEQHMIGKECRIQYENERIERVYWTDYFNKMGALNLLNPALNTYLYPSASIQPNQLLAGVQYMVLQGVVSYGGQNYGPNVNYPMTGGSPTVFTAATITITHTSVTGTYTVNEVVKGSLSGATGTFLADSGTVMTLSYISGTFVIGDVLTGQLSGATATATSVATPATYSVYTGPALVVLYGPTVNTISTVPNNELANIDFYGWIQAGALPCGDYQIAYLLQSSDGFQTSWSYLTQGVGVTVETPDLIGAYNQGQSISYPWYVGNPSPPATNAPLANKSLQWIIKGVDTSFTKILVAYVYTGTFNVPSAPVIFWDDTINGQSDIIVTLTGTENLGTVPGTGVEGLEVQPADVETVKTLTTLKNILFAGNIKSSFNFTWDPSAGSSIGLADYLVPSDILSYPTFAGGQFPNTDIPHGFAIHGHPNVSSALAAHYIYRDQWYQVTGGVIAYPQGTTNYYGTGYSDLFQGLAVNGSTSPNRSYTVVSGSPTIQAVVRIQKYTGTYDINPIVNDFTDSKGMMGDYYLRSLWRTETYRFAILLWKNGAQPQFVNFLGDRTIPAQYSGEIFYSGMTGGPFVVGNTVTSSGGGTGVISSLDGGIGLVLNPDTFHGSFAVGNTITSAGTSATVTSFVNFRLAESETFVADAAAPYLSTDPNHPLGINLQTSLRNIGITVNDLDFTTLAASVAASTGQPVTFANLSNYFDGFSIVRAPRDKQVLCQGLWYFTVKSQARNAGGNTVPMTTEDINMMDNGYVGNIRPNIYEFFSPELQFELNNTAATPLAGDYVSVADYYGPNLEPSQQQSGNTYYGAMDTISDSVSQHYYTKQYVQMPNSGSDVPKNSGGIAITPTGSVFVDTGAPTGTSPGPPTSPSDNSYTFVNLKPQNNPHFSAAGARSFVYTAFSGVTPPGPGLWPVLPEGGAQNRCKKPLINYIRPKGSLYGGTSPGAKANTNYVYVGHYQSFADPGFQAHLEANAGKASGIQVFGGDTFVQMYSVQRLIDIPAQTPTISSAVVFPVESSVDTNFRQRPFFNADRNYGVGTNENVGTGLQSPGNVESYTINSAYSSTFDTAAYVEYPAQPIDFIPADQFAHRVIYSNTKVDGEAIDAYRIFESNNYIDLEGWSGQINNLRAKIGRLLYWQDDSIGYIPVLERALTSNITGDPVTLGTGGVATRYDELRTFWGNQHKHGLCETENDFYWFDNRRKDFLMCTTTASLVEISVVKGLRSYLKNSVIGAVALYDNPVYVDLGYGSSNFGAGIYSEFNGLFKEVIMTFKGVGPVTNGVYTNSGDFTIAFNTITKQFSGRYSFTPGIMLDFYDHFITPSPDLSAQIAGNTAYSISQTASIYLYPQLAVSTSYALYSQVSYGVVNYVNISAYTTPSSNLIQPLFDTTHWQHQNTNDQGSSNYINILPYTSGTTPTQPYIDTTHWTAINELNQVWMHNREQDPTVQVATFYGQVQNSSLTKIFNDKYPMRKVIDSIEQNSDSSFWTTINYTNTTQTGTDTNINTDGTGDFRNIDNAWFFNIPFDNNVNDRLVDGWLSANFVKDNRAISSVTGLSIPTESLNDIMKIVSMIYSYRKTY
jgi:hypothetical protein